jgi:hypothetical protein
MSLPAPAALMPAFLRFAIVWTMPCRPASPMWLLAIETQSRPASLSALRCFGSAEKMVPLAWNRGWFGAGFSKFAIVRSADWR